MNIASWLPSSALLMPYSPALLEGEKVCSKNFQFGETARAFANLFSNEYGIRSGDRIALFMKNCTEYLEVLYAIWWLGAIAVPINSKLHPKEAAWIIENAETKLLFTNDGALSKATSLWSGCTEISIDSSTFQVLLSRVHLVRK